MDLLAKKEGQTLFEHSVFALETWECLWQDAAAPIQDRMNRWGVNYPLLTAMAARAVAWHDLGKATGRWQDYLCGQGKKITHALFSFLAAYHLINGERLSTVTAASLLAILAHHSQLHEAAFREAPIREMGSISFKPGLGVLLETVETKLAGLTPISANQVDFSRELTAFTGRAGARLVDYLEDWLDSPVSGDRLVFKGIYTIILALLKDADGWASRTYARTHQGGKRGDYAGLPSGLEKNQAIPAEGGNKFTYNLPYGGLEQALAGFAGTSWWAGLTCLRRCLAICYKEVSRSFLFPAPVI